MKVVYALITILMVVAFATCKTNLGCSLDCFIASVLVFIGALPRLERGINEGEN